MLVLPLLSLLGCAQHDADVKGEYFAWLAANSSQTVNGGLVDLDGATHIECVRGWNDEQGDWDLGYIGPRQGEVKKGGDWSEKYVGGDCAPTDNDCLAVIDELQAPCEQVSTDQLRMHQFLTNDGFYAFREDLDPWRSEVVLNSEGDFQLAFHHHLEGGEDFRIVFSIAPDFAPIECATDENGNAVARYIDGDVWLDQWSADQPDLDGGTIYYLNGGAVQYDPTDLTEYWILPSQWSAGIANAKLSAEHFWSHPPDYGVYYVTTDPSTGDDEFNGNPAFLIGNSDNTLGSVGDYTGDGKPDPGISHGEFDNDDPEDILYHQLFVDAVEDLTHGGEYDDDSPLTYDQEIADVAGAEYTDGTAFQHRVEGNLWRPVDHTSIGLDGWAEVHSSWVIVDKGSDLSEGGHASGSFQILFDGAESSSAFLVHGTFDTDKIKSDPWGYDDLQEDLRDDSGELFCEGLQPE
jgi:hypothetical protein